MSLDPVAKFMIVVGAVLVLSGIAWQLGWLQALKLGRLPGDISIQRENMRFYFPLTTSLLISAIFTLLSWLFRR